MAVGLGDVDAGADGRRHGLLDEVDTAGACLTAGVDDGTLFHLRDAGGNAHHDPGREQVEAAGDLADELLEHPLRHIVVGNDAVPQGADGHDVAGSTAQHGLSLGAHLQQAAGILVDGHHRRLVEHDALTLNIDQYRCGTHIDPDILCQ